MDTSWISGVILWMGLIDVGIVLAAGVFIAGMALLGKESSDFQVKRLWPALSAVLLSTLAAAIILVALRYFVS